MLQTVSYAFVTGSRGCKWLGPGDVICQGEAWDHRRPGSRRDAASLCAEMPRSPERHLGLRKTQPDKLKPWSV